MLIQYLEVFEKENHNYYWETLNGLQVKLFKENTKVSRKEFLLEKFKEAVLKSSNVKQHQFWRHDNKPISLWCNHFIQEKINYIHNNPVKAGLVFKPENYIYSNAMDYAGKEDLIENTLRFEYYG